MTFLEALFGYLMARLVLNYITTRAKAMHELPIVWAAKTLFLLAALVAVVGGSLLLVASILYRQ